MLVDPGEQMIAARIQSEERLKFSVNTKMLEGDPPCPLCGQHTNQRDPYPGVELAVYRDMINHVAHLYWGCSDCVKLARLGLLSAEDSAGVGEMVTVWEAMTA